MSVLIGFILFAINTAVVLMMTTKKLHIYFDVHSLIVVAGSSVIWVFIAFKPAGLAQFFRILKLIATRKEDRMAKMMEEVIKVSKDTRGEITQQVAASFSSPNLFLKDGITLIADGFSEEQIDIILEERLQSQRDRYKADEKIFKTLRNMPPAFGLIGTTTGMIALFAEVGGADAAKAIGPAMSVAMTATFYGILLGFCVFNPLAERLSVVNHADIRIREMTKKGVLYVKRKAPPSFVEEMLTSYLSFGQQNKRKVA